MICLSYACWLVVFLRCVSCFSSCHLVGEEKLKTAPQSEDCLDCLLPRQGKLATSEAGSDSAKTVASSRLTPLGIPAASEGAH